jgi:hypothetical protein
MQPDWQDIKANFARGLAQKVDPKQLQLGNFEELVNMVFQKEGRLQKRNGFGSLTTLGGNYSYLTTLSWDGVVAPNNQLFIAYNATTGGQSVKVD